MSERDDYADSDLPPPRQISIRQFVAMAVIGWMLVATLVYTILFPARLYL